MSHHIPWASLPLGKISDREVARRLAALGIRVSHNTIRLRRRELGIAPTQDHLKGKVDWDSLPLETASVKEIQSLLRERGISVANSTIWAAKKARGIYPKPPVRIPWATLPLGKITDEDIARQLRERGIPAQRATITRQRIILGIPKFTAPTPFKVDWDSLPFGQVRDSDLAKTVGCSPGIITNHRRRRGIPRSPLPNITPLDLDWDSLPLGKVPDVCLAQHLGLTHPTIITRRRERGLKPAPSTRQNRLLGLVFRHPGQSTRFYADLAKLPEPSSRRSLKQFEYAGLVSFNDSTWAPVILPKPKRAQAQAA
jgi:hypothetical protein